MKAVESVVDLIGAVLGGWMDAFVAGIGTGDTLMGSLKHRRKSMIESK